MLEGGFADVHDSPRDLAPGDHASQIYDDPALIAPFCARYLTEGIDRGERVMALAPEDLRAAIKRLIAPDVDVLVEWSEPDSVYGDFDADRVVSMYDTLMGDEPRTVRILAAMTREAADGVDPAEICRYESMAHRLITRHGAIAVCLYDSGRLAPEYLRAATHHHPLAISGGAVRRNDSFEYQAA